MRSPKLSELPAPPSGKTGWPWTEESEQLPDTLPDGSAWPKISIVTPSYNQAQFIEETIRAVLLQGYPDIEFIIIDGGSKDDTVEVIKKYAPFIAYWVSEKDRGQSDALNKGFVKATGQICYWINSDDLPDKNVFGTVATFFSQNPQSEVVYGDCFFIDQNNKLLKISKSKSFTPGDLIIGNIFDQPTVYFKTQLWHRFGPIREDLRFIMDYELWLRWSLKGVTFSYYPPVKAYFRFHDDSKSTNLQRVNQDEIFALLVQIDKAGELPPQLKPRIKEGLRQLCLRSYWLRDSKQFRSLLSRYIKYTRSIPDFSLLVRAFLMLTGLQNMERISKLKNFLQPKKAKS
jgi:glycosyltransferase involved in cell wall biosynthesis